MYRHLPVRTRMFRRFDVGVLSSVIGCLAACHPRGDATTPHPQPLASIQVGACATPGRDGVMGAQPRVDHADRDLNGDGVAEPIVVDRAMCSGEGNCYWNVFIPPPGGSGDCARYAGTFEGSALEPLASKGDDNMADVRGYWNLHGGRLLLQSYRFVRGGYRIVEALVCKRGDDDKLDCADQIH
jgi:hypothetical protein